MLVHLFLDAVQDKLATNGLSCLIIDNPVTLLSAMDYVKNPPGVFLMEPYVTIVFKWSEYPDF